MKRRDSGVGHLLGSFVPRDPFGSLDIILLQFRHFFHQLVVEAPVAFFAKQFGYNHHIIVLEHTIVFGRPWGSNQDSHVGAHQGGCRVKGFGVASGSTVARLFSDALVGIVTTRVTL